MPNLCASASLREDSDVPGLDEPEIGDLRSLASSVFVLTGLPLSKSLVACQPCRDPVCPPKWLGGVDSLCWENLFRQREAELYGSRLVNRVHRDET